MATDSTPRWTITGQAPEAGPDQSGRYVAGMLVTFRIPSGATGQVFIPQAEWNPATVRSRILAMVETMEQVQATTS